MSRLSDEVAELENQLQAITTERDALRRQVERQKGALEEDRGTIRGIRKELREAGELIGTYQTHFHTFHGSAGHVADQEKALAAAGAPPAQIIEQAPPQSLMDKIARIGRVMARDEKATNGAAH